MNVKWLWNVVLAGSFSLTMCFLMIACRTSKGSTSSGKDVPFYLTKFFKKEEINQIEFVLNQRGDKILCSNRGTVSNRQISYTVYDIDSEEEIYSSAFIGSSIAWYSTDKLIIKGTSRLNPNSAVIVDVVSKVSQPIIRPSKIDKNKNQQK